MRRSWRPICAALVAGAGIACMGQTTNVETDASRKPTPNQENNPVVIIKTTKGDIQAELFADKAPVTVKNFIQYMDDKQYNGTIFHRVIDGLHDPGRRLHQRFRPKADPPADRERGRQRADQPARHARHGAHRTSSTAPRRQFFINVKDNTFLNHRDPPPRGVRLRGLRQGDRGHGRGGQDQGCGDNLARSARRRACRSRRNPRDHEKQIGKEVFDRITGWTGSIWN